MENKVKIVFLFKIKATGKKKGWKNNIGRLLTLISSLHTREWMECVNVLHPHVYIHEHVHTHTKEKVINKPNLA